MGFLATPLGYLLEKLYSLIGNYGITLMVITVIIKLLLYPFYKKQIMSMAGMGQMSGKMKEIQKKYADDKQTRNEKLAELYKEEGVNPMGGCLPMIVQLVVIMALFTILRNPLAYMESATMNFAVHESFLWIRDLSQPDLWILPIITGLTTFVAFLMNSKNGLNGSGMNGAQAGAMNAIMKYFFPIMITYLARSYPAGLAIYWFTSQFIQIFFNIRFNQLRKEMNESKKPAKKRVKRA